MTEADTKAKNERTLEVGGEHLFFAMIPNMIDDLDLSPYAYRLYGHFKRVAGEGGKCYQNTQMLADACHMSGGMVSRGKAELLNKNLITLERSSRPGGGRGKDQIRIVDVWIENHKQFSQREQSPAIGEQGEQFSQGERQSSQGENSIFTTRDAKEDPTLRKPNKEKGDTAPAVPLIQQSNLIHALAKSLASVCLLDYASNAESLLSEARKLSRAKPPSPPPTPDLILFVYGRDGPWYRDDFRGKKGEPPTPSQVRQTWMRLTSMEVKRDCGGKYADYFKPNPVPDLPGDGLAAG